MIINQSRIKFTRINYENECMWDIINDRGFLITDMPFSDVDKSIRNMGGPRSPLFGSTHNDVGDYLDRYRCKCGKHIGAMFEGEICKDCNSKIEFTDVDITTTGWINLTPYKVITPLYFFKLQSALSRKVVENIISNDNIITSSGIIRRHSEPIEVKKAMLTYHNIGLHAFYENFEEIMLYYKNKRKQKADLIDQLIKEKDYVWSSKYPVYSVVLRPQGINSENYYFSPIDKKIHPLTAISLNLKTATPIEVPLYLYQAQLRLNELWAINFGLLDGKHGWIRSSVLGGCWNYSGRCVIVLDVSLKLTEVDLAYKSFVVLFSGQIIREIRKEKGWTLTKCFNYLKSKFNYDPYIHSVMNRLIEQDEIFVIIQRNPKMWGCKNLLIAGTSC